MGKRRMINFARAGFPHYEEVEEEEDPESAAMSIFSPAPGVRMN